MKKIRGKKVCKAFSLLEMLLVLSIVSVLALAGFYGWRAWQEKIRRNLVVHTLEHTLMFAREAALAKREQVSVCAAASDMECGKDWSQGILVFVDLNNQGQPSEKLLMRIPAFPRGTRLTWKGWLAYSYLRFNAEGLPQGYQGSFYLEDQKTPVLVMNTLGRIRHNAI